MSVQEDSVLGKGCLHSQTPLAVGLFTVSLLFDMQSSLHGDAQHRLH